MTTLMNLVRDTKGQDLAEYGIALAVIGAGVAAAAVAIQGSVSTLWANGDTNIAASV